MEANFSADPLEPNGFDFNGAMLSWSLDHGFDEEAKRWWVAVGFATGEAEDKPRCPYAIDIQAVGFFGVYEAVPENKVEALVFENGAALVYGAIRDLVSTTTARGVLGPLMLPTPTFSARLGSSVRGAPGGGRGRAKRQPIDQALPKVTAAHDPSRADRHRASQRAALGFLPRFRNASRAACQIIVQSLNVEC